MIKSALYKRHVINRSISVVLITFLSLVLFPVFSSPAEAALGDFLYKWGGTWGAGDGQFMEPEGIAVDTNGNVYVADVGNNRVQVFSNTGAFIRKWGSQGSGDGQFLYPKGIAVDSNGNVFVSDYNNRVQVFSNTGSFLRKWGTFGTGDGQFNRPRGITVDTNGNVYVADYVNARVQVFTNSGAFLRKWGSQGYNDGQLYNPYDIAVDSSGNVFVTDSYNNRVQVFSNTGVFLRKWGTQGYGDGQFWSPEGIDVDSGGNVYVTEYGANHRVQVFTNSGAFLTKWGSQGSGDGQLYGPYGIAVDSSGKAFVADTFNNRVQVFEGIINCVIIANAGPDQTVEQASPAGAYVTLDGSASQQQGCTGDLTYSWSWPGGSATSANPTVLMPPGTMSVSLLITSGTQTATDSVVVAVRDTLPPVTTSIISGIGGTNGWHVSYVAISLSASDLGSGVKEIHYSINGSETIVTGGTASFMISADGSHGVSYFAKDFAGNSEAAHPLTIKIDKTPPAIVITGVVDGAVYTPGVVPVPGYTATDTLSGVESHSALLTGTATSNGTVYAYRVDARDLAGNASSASVTYTVAYGFSGFLEPISLGKPFKLGSTIPVKFRLTDTQGNYISTAQATIMVQQFTGDDPVGDPIILSANGADSGDAFRYDAVGNLYIFNLGTKDLVQGTWQIRALLDDGSVKGVFIQLKKN